MLKIFFYRILSIWWITFWGVGGVGLALMFLYSSVHGLNIRTLDISKDAPTLVGASLAAAFGVYCAYMAWDRIRDFIYALSFRAQNSLHCNSSGFSVGKQVFSYEDIEFLDFHRRRISKLWLIVPTGSDENAFLEIRLKDRSAPLRFYTGPFGGAAIYGSAGEKDSIELTRKYHILQTAIARATGAPPGRNRI